MLIYDTSVLLKLPVSYTGTPFCVTILSLSELKKIIETGSNEELRKQAQSALGFLEKNKSLYKVIFGEEKMNEVTFLTCDLVLYHRLLSDGYAVKWYDDPKKEIYKGYKWITGNTEYLNSYMEHINLSKWSVNEYLIMENTDDGTAKELRFDGTNFVRLKLPPQKIITGKNALQRCAIDALNNPNIPIIAILGGYGSGKTALTSRMALYNVQDKGNQSKIIGIREYISDGAEIGFLPGEKDTKLEDFFMPFADQLEGGEFELESLKQRGTLEVNTPFFIKGRTYNSACLLVDEAEDLTEKQIRLIGTRVGEGSRIFYNGDYSQSVIDTSKGNALVKMCNALKGDPMFACVYLEEDVRSTTSKIFSKLF